MTQHAARPDRDRASPTAADRALADARRTSFWLDDATRPASLPPLTGDTRAQLAVVGGGYSGLWTALLAKERDPGRDVLLVEGRRLGWAASGRNGGFAAASLTHGRPNGERHLPGETDRLDALGLANLGEIEETVARYGWDCDFERTGSLTVATQPYQIEEIRSAPGFLGQEDVRAQVNSPTYLAGLAEPGTTALVHPGKLVWALRQTCLDLGVRIAEGTPVRSVTSDRSAVVLHHTTGQIVADRVALATNAFPALLKRFRLHTIPVYDYALMTEPLSPAQRASIGWAGRQGLDDMGNQFHYYRLTRDDRILFGGYDAIYHFGRSLNARHDHRDTSYRTLARHFFETFPQLAGLRFTHAWGGAVDTSTRFFAFVGTGHRRRVAHAAGFTGLGVAATRFMARITLDVLDGEQTELTQLRLSRSVPPPFPPEPLAWVGVRLTTRALRAADRNDGRRNLWLRGLDRLGVGFDS